MIKIELFSYFEKGILTRSYICHKYDICGENFQVISILRYLQSTVELHEITWINNHPVSEIFTLFQYSQV